MKTQSRVVMNNEKYVKIKRWLKNKNDMIFPKSVIDPPAASMYTSSSKSTTINHR